MGNLKTPNRRSLVLVVDDDMLLRHFMRESLEQAGFQVMEAENGSKAVQISTEARPEIVLIDVEMPNMDGFAACAALRRSPHGQDTPVLMITGPDDVESVHRAFEVGATDFLTKPINGALLGYRLQHILRASRRCHELKGSEARLAKAQQTVRFGLWEWNVSEDHWFVSDGACRILGFAQGDRPANREAMLKFVHPDDRDRVFRLFAAALRGEKKYEIEYKLILPDGTSHVVGEQAEVSFNKQAEPEQVEGTLQDLTERRQAEARVQYLAYHDGLTGLPNRQMFSEQAGYILRTARRSKMALAMLSLDLDNFKAINESLGHDAGDGLLRQVADRISGCVRTSDLISHPGREAATFPVFRFGGDEFTVLLANLQHEHDTLVVVRRIMTALKERFVVGGHDLFATASIGIAMYPSDGGDLGTLLRNADSAMHHAKQKGKNTFQFYTESLTRIAIERMNMEAELHRAIEQGELELYFQPKIEIQSGRLAGAEALLRWNTSPLGSVPPARFIPLAEETGLIIPIGEWVLKKACCQMQVWEKVGLPPVTMAVNVSARQFQHSDLSKSISSLLTETGLRPQCLELELTESAIMADVEKAKLTLQKLSALGVRLSIDDFGTGCSSLSQLRWLPLEALKIDRSFVKDLPADESCSAITLAIIALAHSLGLRAVAEGVETEAQFEFLKERGCDEVQGYLFSPPVPALKFAQLFDNSGLSICRRNGSVTGLAHESMTKLIRPLAEHTSGPKRK